MDGESRYTRSWKCQVSVGELYRWILAKLSDKDIKRALHKYRDLMPRQSDWNRKLTQATNVPELGFRYLYRCGQIDETNHRTMQKMLKYIDRQDVLPYFDTILYNSNTANFSIEELQKQLLDRVDVFLRASTALTEDEVHPLPPYEIQCQSLEDRRFTRSLTKRKSCDPLLCMTFAKRARKQCVSHDDSPSSSSSQDDQDAGASRAQAYSAIKACTLSGPALQTILNASLFNVISVIHMSNSSSSNPNQPRFPYSTISNFLSNPTFSAIYNSGLLSHPRMPNLLSMIRFHFAAVRPSRPPEIPPFAHLPFHQANPPTEQRVEVFQRQLMLSGGVGVTASDNDSLIRYYCRIRLRIKLDLGNSREILQNFIASDRHDPFSRQMDIYLQAVNLLRNRIGSEFCCTFRFNRLDHLEAFWSDYTSGALKKLLIANLLASDKTSFVGHGSWLENEDISTSTATSSETPGPIRRHSTSRRNRNTSSGHPSRTFSPFDELQKVMIALRRQIYQSNTSELNQTPAQAATQAAMQHPAVINNPVLANVFGLGHAHIRRQNLQGDQSTHPPAPAPDFDINLFVPRLEYENGRMLLMRNERAIPSLPRLLAASQIVSSSSGNNASSLNLPSTSGIALEPVFH
nr:DNA binding death effector domain containing protein [Hymenolepis microstoma]